MAMVTSTSYQRSVGMEQWEAQAIAAQRHLFGYTPDITPIRGSGWHLSVCSDADATVVRQQLALLRRRGQ